MESGRSSDVSYGLANQWHTEIIFYDIADTTRPENVMARTKAALKKHAKKAAAKRD